MVSYCYCYCCWANILENTHAPVHYGDILGNLSSSAESSTNHPHSAAFVELANVMGLFPRPTHMPICNKIKLQSILSSSGMPNKYLMKCLWINTDERASECNSRDSPQRGWCARHQPQTLLYEKRIDSELCTMTTHAIKRSLINRFTSRTWNWESSSSSVDGVPLTGKTKSVGHSLHLHSFMVST